MPVARDFRKGHTFNKILKQKVQAKQDAKVGKICAQTLANIPKCHLKRKVKPLQTCTSIKPATPSLYLY